MLEFKFPDVGEGITEGEVVKWLAKEGDKVEADQNIVQVETDKAVADIPAPEAGTLLKVNKKEGETIKVGEVLCVIGEPGEAGAEETKNENSEIKEGDSNVNDGVRVGGDSLKVDEKEEVQEEATSEEKPESAVRIGIQQTAKVSAAPAVRKTASEHGIDISKIKGSGEDGRILMKDLGVSKEEKTIAEKVPQQKVVVKKKYDDYGYLERVPVKGIRKVIAKNMMESLAGSAQLTSMEDIDVSKLWELRKKEKAALEKKGIKLTFMPFIIKACIAALKENPVLNSSLEEDEILIKKYFNIGIAVETPVGLMVPVIKIAEDKNIETIAKEIVDLSEKARTRKIDIMDLKGSTFTITNYGSVGGTYATPVLNTGEASILGLGRIFDRVVLNKRGAPVNAKILPVSLTFDHRILDGAEAARFMESLKKYLEDPEHLIMALT